MFIVYICLMYKIVYLCILIDWPKFEFYIAIYRGYISLICKQSSIAFYICLQIMQSKEITISLTKWLVANKTKLLNIFINEIIKKSKTKTKQRLIETCTNTTLM